MDVSISQDPFAPDVPATHMLAGAKRPTDEHDEPGAPPLDASVDGWVDTSADAFDFTTGGTGPDPTPPQESAGPTEDPESTQTQEDSDELPDA